MRLDNLSYGERIEVLAREAIRGTFGNADNRKMALGKMYYPVQQRVNEIMRNKIRRWK